MPPVSNVFHSCPQVQHQQSSLRGDQPQSGQRMRERGIVALVSLKLAIQDNRLVMREGAHASILWPSSDARGMHADFRTTASTLDTLTLPEQP